MHNQSLRTVAALFVRADSPYKAIPCVEAFDEERDARTFDFSCPVIAHPPCRAWGKFAWRARPRPHEKDLAHWAMDAVERCGGVLEHPVGSSLFKERAPLSGSLVKICQSDFGHRALKPTWLYICGHRGAMPLPPWPAHGSFSVENMGKAEREKTPPLLAEYLVQVARNCGPTTAFI